MLKNRKVRLDYTVAEDFARLFQQMKPKLIVGKCTRNQRIMKRERYGERKEPLMFQRITHDLSKMLEEVLWQKLLTY